MSSRIAMENTAPHAVCIPCPAQGHIHALLKLTRLLHSRGFHITFVHTEANYNRILTSGGPSAIDNPSDGFRYETIPDGLPPSANQDPASLCTAMLENFAVPFRGLLKRLNDPTSGVPPVTCIVSDSATPFTVGIAEEFGIPCVLFCPWSAAAYLAEMHFGELEQRGLWPAKDETECNGTVIDWIRGLKKVPLEVLVGFSSNTDPKLVIFNYLKEITQQASQASAIMLNTFDDLEGDVVDALALLLPPIYTIGPLTVQCRRSLPSSWKSDGSNSLWKEDDRCLEWLDGRASGSVLYMNFGSVALMTSEQLIEFAWGLASSSHNFLWVIRPDAVVGDSTILPKEFWDETKGRGLLTSWCPQEEVLMHPAIGGFLTHCGWNSTMEAISAGMPVLCWPYFADQLINCSYMCHEWGIGMKIDNNVKREEVERVIRQLMAGEKGEKMRRRALEWKDKATAANEARGKSFMNLERVMKEVMLKNH